MIRIVGYKKGSKFQETLGYADSYIEAYKIAKEMRIAYGDKYHLIDIVKDR